MYRNFLNTVRLYLLLLGIGLLVHPAHAVAQADDLITLSGTVMDPQGQEIPGANIYIKGKTIGVISSVDGHFQLSGITKGDSVCVAFIGFETYSMKAISSENKMKVVLQPNVTELDETIVVGHGTQRKVTTTGAITTISADQLQVPASSVSNMLAGRVPGIIGMTRSGEPGNDYSEFWIRGISTFGANQGALILIDGVEGNLDDIDPIDIESFSVLKDASATAVYGNRGANGVVLVTTKRGDVGKLKVSVRANTTMTQSARLPEYVNAVTYATLANEAMGVRGLKNAYSDADIELFRNGLDPDLHPDVNWQDEILKSHSWYSQANVNISGGGQAARYYMSVGYQDKQGVFKQDDAANKYDVDVNYRRYNFRANIDANLTPTTVMSLNLNDVIGSQNMPGYDDNRALWGAQANLTPVAVPVRYSNGQLPAYGSSANQISPYVLLNHTGYKNISTNALDLKVNFEQKLDFITDGLIFNAIYAYTNFGEHITRRYKIPSLYYASGRQNDGTLLTKEVITSSDAMYSQDAYTERQTYIETKLMYNKVVGDHRFSGLLLSYWQDGKDSEGAAYDQVIPVRYQAVSARATYSYKDTYMFEMNGGYSGSMDFKKGEQYGFFPAVSAGWVPTQYEWTKNNVPFVNFFKIRASWGQVGNGELDQRFPYLSLMNYGSNYYGPTMVEGKVGVDNLKWEVATKYDAGIDAKFWDNRFDLTFDIYMSKNDNIYQQRTTIPEEVGAPESPWINAGSMKSWGFDGNISYTQRFKKDMSLTIRSNMTVSRNEVTHWEQTGINYPYQSYTGVPYGVQRGYVALGLFENQADIDNSPRQTFMNNYLPGDIKYKDVNGDGIIDSDDVVPLDYSAVPQMQYGFAGEFSWKSWTVSAFFTGSQKVSYFLGGTGYYPFVGEEEGNILTIVADQSNRWTPASYSGTTATENPNARFPRLTYGNNANNNQASTFWLADASFLRLKNVEISYRVKKDWLSKIGVSSANISLIGNNLFVWDDVDLWDPEQASTNGAVYPIQRTFTLQLNATF